MFAKIWDLLKDTVSGFLDDEALSRAAAIAYFTIFSIAPLLLIVITIAGFVFGQDAARAAVMGQFTGLMGKGSGDALQSMLQSAGSQSNKAGTIATIVGLVTLLLTASGAFGEIQSALNKIWKAEPKSGVTRLVKARMLSMGLVLTLGFLMLVSLVLSAGLTAFGHWVEGIFPSGKLLMSVMNFVISLVLLSAVFAAIYKFLPDTAIDWRDVAIGAVATALMFTIGKSLIGLYIGGAKVAESYGAAGSLIVILVWIYYSTLIFLFGAEFTRAFAEQHGSHASSQRHGEAMKPHAFPTRAEQPSEKPTALRPLPDVLEQQTAMTRADMAHTWQMIRNRLPSVPRSPLSGSRPQPRPSWLQMLVAGLAVATLPPVRRPDQASKRQTNEPVVPFEVSSSGPAPWEPALSGRVDSKPAIVVTIHDPNRR
jgi:membrane protein